MTDVLIEDFSLVENLPPSRRIVIAIDGRDRQGKTHFCFTAPSPIMYFDFDMGSEGMAEKFVADSVMQGQFEHAGKIIVRSRPFVVRPPEASGTESNKDNQDLAKQEWLRLWNGYLHGLSKPIIQHKGKAYKARTIVIDTGSEMEELMRIAWFGKLTQVASFLYRERNSIMRDLVRRALESDVNVIFTHKLSAEWTKNAGGDQAKQSKTGAYERKGYEEMAHLVQANLFAYRCPPPGSIPVVWKYKPGTGEPHSWTAAPRDGSTSGFVVRCLDSRQNPELEGFEWEGEAATFANVAMLLQPGSTDADWANAHD